MKLKVGFSITLKRNDNYYKAEASLEDIPVSSEYVSEAEVTDGIINGTVKVIPKLNYEEAEVEMEKAFNLVKKVVVSQLKERVKENA